MTNWFIYLPDETEMKYLRDKFFELPPIYGTIRAIDGTHIPIEAPQKYPASHINRKGFHSISF